MYRNTTPSTKPSVSPVSTPSSRSRTPGVDLAPKRPLTADICGTWTPTPSTDTRWTSRYLLTNPRLKSVVGTLLELAYLPPSRSLQFGKVRVEIAPTCGSHHYGSAGMLVSSTVRVIAFGLSGLF